MKKVLFTLALSAVLLTGGLQLATAASGSCEADCFLTWDENCRLPRYKCNQLLELCLQSCY